MCKFSVLRKYRYGAGFACQHYVSMMPRISVKYAGLTKIPVYNSKSFYRKDLNDKFGL